MVGSRSIPFSSAPRAVVASAGLGSRREELASILPSGAPLQVEREEVLEDLLLVDPLRLALQAANTARSTTFKACQPSRPPRP